MNSVTVTVKVYNEFASGSELRIYQNGEEINNIDLVKVILPYLTHQSAWNVIVGEYRMDLYSTSTNQVSVRVDFTGYSNLSRAPKDPEVWLEELEAKCRLVHEFFKAEHPKRTHTVTRDITIYA